MAILSDLWLGYIKVKHRLFGLMPLQGFVNKYHKEDPDKDPLWTYWLFLTYEAEVLEALKKAREQAIKQYNDLFNDNDGRMRYSAENEKAVADAAEKEAYLGITAELRNADNLANHNINKKVFLHLMGLALISLLMIGIAGSNTMALTGFLAENGVAFGAYTNLVTGFFYASAVWAQWMIFRRGVTKMLKSLLSWSNGGLDFFETAELELTKGRYKYDLRFKRESQGNIKDSELPGYYSRRARSLFYGLCTAACAMTWGVLVYTKLSDGLHDADGFFAIGTALSQNFGLLFGSLAGFAAFFLWLTTLRADLKAEERAEREAVLKNTYRDKSIWESGVEWYKDYKKTPTALLILIAVTLYALLASMLGQGRIVFETLGWENANGNPLDPKHPQGLLYFGIFITAIVIGRMNFSIRGMRTFYDNTQNISAAMTKDKIDKETYFYRSNYVVGCMTILVLVCFFAASLHVEELRKPMAAGSNGHKILSPMGLMTVCAMLVWTVFLALKRFKDGTPEEADKKEAAREEKTAWFPSGSIRKGCEERTGNALIASIANGVAFGGIGGKGVQGTVEDIGNATQTNPESDQPAWVAPAAFAAAVPGQAALGLQSVTTSTAQVQFDKVKLAARAG